MDKQGLPGPKYGLVSQTVIPSPTIQWILPARLRHRLRNDVIFVGDQFIQIKEVVSGVYLQDATAKVDFDAKITAAKVIDVNTELPWDTQMKLQAGPYSPKNAPDLPPQILVLALASKELVFLYCIESQHIQFAHFIRPLPSDMSLLERFGRHLAVDPRSRAIAIASSSDYFGIFPLRQQETLQSQIARKELYPILEERFFRVDGDILFMEFLYPKAEDNDRIVLLLLVSKDQQTHTVFYDWDATQTLRQFPPNVLAKPLHSEDALPTLVIPLRKEFSLMLVTTSSIAVYKNSMDYTPQSSRYPIPGPSGQSQRSPLWTRWARPNRNWLYNQKHDDIYLCREDGVLFYLEIGADGDIECQTHLGQLCPDIDAAFDVLGLGFEGGDLLLAVSSTGDGGLFVQNARDSPRCVQKFSNWALVTDSVLVRDEDNSCRNHHVTYTGRLFICSGSTNGRGAIVELRRGIEAQIGLVLGLDELSSAGEMWALADPMKGGIHIVISDPMSTSLLYLPADHADEISAVDEASSGLNTSSVSLAAGCTQSGAVIQVTKRTIHVGGIHDTSPRATFEYELNQEVTVAAVSPAGSFVVTAVRMNQVTYIHLARVSCSESQCSISGIESPVSIDVEPVCLSIEQFNSISFIFAGACNGTLQVFRVEEESIRYLSTHSLSLADKVDLSMAIESIAKISASKGSNRRSALLCGLRCGYLSSFDIDITGNGSACSIGLTASAPRQLGTTSVKILSRGNFAVVTCGDKIWRLSHFDDDEAHSLSFDRVWITDQNNPAYRQKSVDVFTILDLHPSSGYGSISESLFCITERQLFVCTLGRKAQTVPRRIDLPGSATRLAYSEHLRSLIVAYSTTEFDVISNPVKRFTRSTIEFVDLDSEVQSFHETATLTEACQSLRGWRPRGAAGEKITCILDWTPRRGAQTYHFIVISTARKHRDGHPRGRVIFLQASRDSTDPSRIECSVKYNHKFTNPVYAIAPYSDSSLIVATGHDIVPLEHEVADVKFSPGARYTLLSPARSITVREPYIFVSTARESLMVLKVVNNTFVLHSHDRVKRDGLSHMVLPPEPDAATLTLTSSKGGTVSLFTEEGVTDKDKLLPMALSEAHLPLSVMKLHYISKLSVADRETVYGTTVDGTVYCFHVVFEDEMRLYWFLQNLAMTDITICPFTSKRKKRNSLAYIEPSGNKPSQSHIDGDVLSRLVQRGAAHLRRMLSSNATLRSNVQDPSGENRILERFQQLAGPLHPHSDDLVTDVFETLREFLGTV